MAAAPPPTLTLEQAKEAVKEAVAVMETPENKAKLEALVVQAETMATTMSQGDEAKKAMFLGMQRMSLLMPAASAMVGSVMAKYGFDPSQMMMAIMQIKAFEGEDAEIAEAIKYVMAKMQGN
jgi:hypothetical protein